MYARLNILLFSIALGNVVAFGCGNSSSSDLGASSGWSGGPGGPGAVGPDAGAAADSGSGDPDGQPPGQVGTTNEDPLGGLPSGAQQLQNLCARNNGDTVAKAFCASSTPPSITSLVDLETILGIAFKPGVITNGVFGHSSPAFALTAHSSSLVRRITSQLNPRAFVFTPALQLYHPTVPKPNPNYVIMSFARGEQFVELASKDPTANAGKGDVRFYLFRFTQACNQSANGCTPGDLLTPEIEKNFTGYSLYEDVDVKDTTLDCMSCHQQKGPGTPKQLLQPEAETPWTHWFGPEPAPNVRFVNEFQAAHGTAEDYGGIPAAAIVNSRPQELEAFRENNLFRPAPAFQREPNEFDGNAIGKEVVASNPLQPAQNVPPGVSATWQTLFNSYVTGQAIPPPYHDFRIVDDAKLATMTAAYKSYVSGATPKDKLPDITDVLLDAALPDMAIAPHAGQTGAQILTEMCIECHNSHLDQTISRARFNVERLDQMSRAEKDEAIRRVNLPRTSAQHMPPSRFRDLGATDIQAVVQELQK